MNKDFCLIYFHGFKSSPESTKATFIKQFAENEDIDYYCPPLDISPEIAIDQVNIIISNALKTNLKPVLIGSSLGGFYTTWAMQNHPDAEKCIAIMLNPSTKPANDLKDEVEKVKDWQEQTLGNIFFKETHLNYLKILESNITGELKNNENILLVAAKGDEVLDWKEMVAFFKDCKHYIIEGSDHSLSNFPVHWSFITNFISSR
jgi:predicted esterase YcpF (UPF0227 family)